MTTLSPFSMFKPYKRPETADWPLYSNFLNESLDIAPAQHHYFVYTSLVIATVWTTYYTFRYRSVNKLIPNSVVSDMNKHKLLDEIKARRFKGIFFPIITIASLSSYGAIRRNEECDRSGDRMRNYWTRAHYSGLNDDAALALAKEIVLRTNTHKEGTQLLDLALNNLVLEGIIPEPNYDAKGVFTIPSDITHKMGNGEIMQHGEDGKFIPTGVIPDGFSIDTVKELTKNDIGQIDNDKQHV